MIRIHNAGDPSNVRARVLVVRMLRLPETNHGRDGGKLHRYVHRATYFKLCLHY